MKKRTMRLALILALALVLSLAACGRSGGQPKDNGPAANGSGGTPAGQVSDSANGPVNPAADSSKESTAPAAQEPASLVGTWYGEMQLMGMMYGGEIEDADYEEDNVEIKWVKLVRSKIGEMPVGFFAELGADGRYSVRFDKRSFEAITEEAQKLWPEMEAIRLDMTVEELEKRLAAEGMTMEELFEEDRSDLEEFTTFTELAEAGYILDHMPYEVDGDKLILTIQEEEEEEDPGFQPVITFICTADTLKLIKTDSEAADSLFAGLTLTRVG